jgi:hypothetical protein
VDPYPDPISESGSGFRRAKMTHKNRKNEEISCFHGLKKGFFCSLDVVFGDLGIGKCQF